MPNAFNFSISPFDCLTADERRLVRDSIDIAYFREGEAILEPGAEPTHLFVIIKGFVNETDGEELVATYGADDCFDGRGLIAGKAGSRFVAAEEVLAYQLARAAVTELIASNATFGALLFADLSKKLSALTERHSQHEMQSLTTARVSELRLRPARFIDAGADIVSVVRFFDQHRTANVLVRDESTNPHRIGIFTNTGLQRAILDGRPLDQLPVRDLANFKLVTARPADYLFDVLATMIRHRVRRVVVKDGDEITGILEQLDLMSYLSNHSTLITRQINEAPDLAALKAPAEQITRLIALLFRVGTKVSLIAKLVQELNAKLFERAWTLIAPADLVENACLFVMGSEGRGEQLLKTDQDNGLILRDGYDCPHDLPALCQQLSDALKDFGYPECPGRIMVNNPEWRMPAAEFGQTVRRWLLMPTAETLMALAIFLDAHPVCGDAELLEQVRGEVFKLVNDNDALLARFAAAINAFADSSGWWNRLFSLDSAADQMDIKKAGTFPLVHGIRALALDARLEVTGTVDRIEALVAAGKLAEDMGTDLIDSLHFFMGLKLKLGLAALDRGRAKAGGVEIDKLSNLDRDLLKDALGVVKRFRGMLSHRFRLDAL
ncbi:DUF294 nucleotidyltransferase-like domain-containing protein [Derxia gummosa]|uniref:DUF294 nucleotidyltransferase-like domain-containing protein n=1 Tax=Derxia gummosa DSM 723 TaxID=1121388 RepID=A0A8B6X738_9BURK|nr:DUF294 nucleotidyltransferase-like domain-containing protein [Derxia gummosa]